MRMPKINNISSKETIKVAQEMGYIITRQKGSHIVLKNSENKIIVIPNHNKLKTGTILQIIKLLEITKEEFFAKSIN